jgi:Calcineurin-like phosphoesterase
MPKEPDLSTYPGMTKWFSPRLLVWAAYRDVAARIFGEYADRRTTQHLADPIPSADDLRRGFVFRYDYATGAGDKPFWVDFVADLGDGFDSTYSIAYLVAADKLYGKGPAKDGIAGIKGLPPGQELPHGRLLLFGGDQIYPWPTREAYDQRTFKPYDLALPSPPAGPDGNVPPASRHVFAIPGNHDWYDGLNAFDDQFCRARASRYMRQGRRFGDFQTCQHRSSFAIKLPHNWWIWGADIQLTNALDSGQLDYFTAVADCMEKGDKFILLTAEPSWYHIGEPEGDLARDNLQLLIAGATSKGAKLCGILSGDSHHYARYNESQELGNLNLITAGGGGAYTHGTYHLKNHIKLDWFGRDFDFRLDRKLKPDDSSAEATPKQTNSYACYPSKARSRASALNAFKFPANNVSFCVAVGIIYWLMTWTFANLRVDAWLTIPEGQKITRGLTQSPFQLRECLQEGAEGRTKLRQSRASGKDVKSCILGSEERTFTGTGTVEEWTLQTMEYFFKGKWYSIDNIGAAFVKGYHLLLLGVVNSIFAAVFLFAVLIAFFVVAKSKYMSSLGLASRGVQALGHLFVHLSIMWGLYSVLAHFNYNAVDKIATQLPKLGESWKHWLGVKVANDGNDALQLLWIPMEFWARIVYPIEMIFFGGLLGAWAFAIYLSLAYGLGKVNFDWVFSSQRIADYKCFLRMRFEPDKLTIYPIGLDRVPARDGWRWRRDPAPRQSRVEPRSPLRPRLIEGPIVIRDDEIPAPDPREVARALAAASRNA